MVSRIAELEATVEQLTHNLALQSGENQMLDFLTDNMTQAVAVYDVQDQGRKFVFKSFNKTAERMDCVKRELLLGKEVRDVFQAAQGFGIIDVFERVWKTGREELFPMKLYQGEEFTGWRDNYIFKLPNGCIAAVYNDVSAQKNTIDELERKTRILDSINSLYQQTLDVATIRDVAHVCLRIALDLTGAKFGFIGELNEQGLHDTIAISDTGWKACRIPESNALVSINNMAVRGLWGHVIAQAAPLLTNEPPQHPASSGVPDGHPPLVSFLGVPLLDGGKAFGMIALANKPDGFTARDLEDVQQLCAALVLALQKKRAELDLHAAHQTLETRVEQRTKQLATVNENLKKEIALRTKAEDELHTQWRTYLTILENFPEVLYVTDPQTHEVLFVNRVFREMLGNDPQGGICYEKFQGLSGPCPFCTNITLLETRQPCVWEHYNPLVDKHFMINDQLILWPDGREVRFELAVDISLQKQAEIEKQKLFQELERSNKELEQFAYIASHDLQEPLRMVSSYTQLLERRYKDKLDADATDFINFAVDGANRMQRLINDLLDFSRINTRSGNPDKMDPHRAVGQAIVNLQASIDETRAIVSTEDMPAITADFPQIAQLFLNLIGNAIKFRSQESPRIHISATTQGDLATFTVRDNGIGIDPEYAEKIFQIFQRLHSKTDYPGTGIGLAICKRIVEKHGGRIWVESAPGQGTAFKFTMPL
jgi:signal transduction histidine kinase